MSTRSSAATWSGHRRLPRYDEELDIVDIFDQYRPFCEYLKEVPGDLEIRMIPGNHVAVRFGEPQPDFNEETAVVIPTVVVGCLQFDL